MLWVNNFVLCEDSSIIIKVCHLAWKMFDKFFNLSKRQKQKLYSAPQIHSAAWNYFVILLWRSHLAKGDQQKTEEYSREHDLKLSHENERLEAYFSKCCFSL